MKILPKNSYVKKQKKKKKKGTTRYIHILIENNSPGTLNFGFTLKKVRVKS